MKKAILFFSVFMLAFTAIHAQPSTNSTEPTNAKANFLGAWDLLLIGVPQGDVSCQLVLEEKEGKLSGFLKFDDSQGGKVIIEEPVIKDSVLTFNATLQSYDVNFNLTLNKEERLNGTLFDGMFEATGQRSVAVDPAKEK